MLTKTGVKLLDFGIAELRDPVGSTSESAERKESVTLHTTSGTLAYMAPEQIEGRETDARTDIFAFGALTYEMITGWPAFQLSSQPRSVASVLNESAAISHIDPKTALALDSVIGRCLARQPSDRWQSCSDVLLMLRRIAETANRQ